MPYEIQQVIQKISRTLFLPLAVLTLAFGFSTPQVLAAVPPTPTVTPASAIDSLATPYFALDVKACVDVLDWKAYFASTTANYNPFVAKGCMSDINIVNNGSRTVTKNTSNQVTSVAYNTTATTLRKAKYSDFTLGDQTALTNFGNIPVMGIRAQGLNAFDIDGSIKTSVANSDRGNFSSLSSIFSATQINQLFVNSTSKTGLERMINTGPEIFNTTTNPITYQGGFCKTANDKIALRTTFSGVDQNNTPLSYPLNPSDYNLNASSPITSCGFGPAYATTNTNVKVCNPDDFGSLPGVVKGTCTNVAVTSNPKFEFYVNQQCNNGCIVNYYDPDGVVRDQKLWVYQTIYKVPFAQNQAQCDDWFPGVFSNNYASCIDWFRTRIALPLTGQNAGDNLCYAETYYGSLNSNKQWVGWSNPDTFKARKTFTSSATLEQLRNYYGDDIGFLKQLFGDATSSPAVIVGKLGTATQAQKDAYRGYLKAQFEAYVRGADGYSTYLC